MNKNFLMKNNTELRYSTSGIRQPTFISNQLRCKLFRNAIELAFEFYSEFFGESVNDACYEKLVYEYIQHFSDALSFGLFERGTVQEKDHLNLWVLSRVFAPQVYIESGVFTGASLHAFLSSPKLERVIAIDPDLSELKIPKDNIPGLILIDDKDFSGVTIGRTGRKTFAFFDDHINTASRIVQASDKGIKYMLIDDSTGFEGICQRLYPAVPTIPMIMNCDLLTSGDELSWTFRDHYPRGLLKQTFLTLKTRIQGGVRVSLIITNDLIASCYKARGRIEKYSNIPDLGEYCPQMYPTKTGDTSKFLIKLVCD